MSAVVRSSSGVAGGAPAAALAAGAASSATNMISPMIDESGASTGGPTLSGSVDATVASFSVTVWRARWTSAPQSKSTQMTATPTAVAERTRRTPDEPLRTASIGKVTSASMSLGAIPCASTSTVTVGAVRSGSTSTGMRVARAPPQRRKAPAAVSTTRRLRNDQRMSALISMARSLLSACVRAPAPAARARQGG